MPSDSNRFDFLRLLFALGVFAYHAVVLSSVDVAGHAEGVLGAIAEVSVQGFFVISGALVFGSWQRSQSVADYAGKRVRRLLPAYLVVITVPAIVALSIASFEPGILKQVATYFGANAVFLNFLSPTLPGLFEGQRFTEVNGSLWTLKIEVMFYLVLPAIAWVWQRLGKAWWVLFVLLYVGALAWQVVVSAWDHRHAAELARQLPGQMAFFASGMALWQCRDWARRHVRELGLIGVMGVALGLLWPVADFLRAASLAALVAWAAFAPGPALRAARWGDVSYGVYITHFPVLQALVALGVFASIGFALGLVLATALVFFCSYVLWFAVEKPALRRNSHYRRAEKGS